MARTPTVLSAKAEAEIQNLIEKDEAYRAAAAEGEKAIRERMRAELNDHLAPFRDARNLAAYRAFRAGAPKVQIAKRGLSTTSFSTASAAVAAGEAVANGSGSTADTAAVATIAATTGGNVTVKDGGEITFAPNVVDLDVYAERLGLTEDERTDPENTVATFTVEDGIIVPITASPLPSGRMHPVVAMVMADGSKHAEAIREAGAA